MHCCTLSTAKGALAKEEEVDYTVEEHNAQCVYGAVLIGAFVTEIFFNNIYIV